MHTCPQIYYDKKHYKFSSIAKKVLLYIKRKKYKKQLNFKEKYLFEILWKKNLEFTIFK